MTTTATARSEAGTEVTLGLSRTVDSVIVRETVVIRDRPDTVTVWRDRTQWRTRTVHDTLVVVKTDTVVRTETVEVERQSPALAGTPLKGGRGTRTPGWAWAAVLALAGLLAAQIIRVRNKLNNR